MVFAYEDWDTYKVDLLNKDSVGNIIHGTLIGNIKPKLTVIKDVLINDSFHLECNIYNGYVVMNIKAYKVDEENLKSVVNRIS
jgi:hypothetical protein